MKEKLEASSALSFLHRIHGGKDFGIKVTIVVNEIQQTSTRKALEALGSVPGTSRSTGKGNTGMNVRFQAHISLAF